jgi:hypothetical protein
VLIFIRGEWCPRSNLRLPTYQAHLDQMAALGAPRRGGLAAHVRHSLSIEETDGLGVLGLWDVGASVIDGRGLKYEGNAETFALFEAVGHGRGAHKAPGD